MDTSFLNAAALHNENSFSKARYTVFGLGDSPDPKTLIITPNPGRTLLDVRLEQLGGEYFIELGLGDDQDIDGPETGYKIWEPKVWKTLGIDSVQVTEVGPEPITNEHIKAASETFVVPSRKVWRT